MARGCEKAVKCIETGKIYPSIIAASRDTGVSHHSIGYCVAGHTKTAGRMRWVEVPGYVRDPKTRTMMPPIDKVVKTAMRREKQNGGHPVSYGDIQREHLLKLQEVGA